MGQRKIFLEKVKSGELGDVANKTQGNSSNNQVEEYFGLFVK